MTRSSGSYANLKASKEQRTTSLPRPRSRFARDPSVSAIVQVDVQVDSVTRRKGCRRSDGRAFWRCLEIQARAAAAVLPMPPALARAQAAVASDSPTQQQQAEREAHRGRVVPPIALRGRDCRHAGHGLAPWHSRPASLLRPSGLARPSAPGTRALAPRRLPGLALHSPSLRLSPAVAAPRAREVRALGPLLAAASPDSGTTTEHRPRVRS